jgi:hypothetical protein
MSDTQSLPPAQAFKLPPDLLVALHELAVAEDISVGCLVTLLLDEALDHRLAQLRRR